MKRKRIEAGKAFAFECSFGLCHWAEPTRIQLTAGRALPSPEAKVVAVRIIRETDYRALLNKKPQL